MNWKGFLIILSCFIPAIMDPTGELYAAIKGGLVTKVKELGNLNNVNVAADQKTMRTPLTLAISCERYDIVVALLEMGAIPNVADLMNQSPAVTAIMINRADILELLSYYGADFDEMYKSFTMLNLALYKKSVECAKFLMRYYTPKPNSKGICPIHYAVNHPEILSMILEKETFVDYEDSEGLTALLWSAKRSGKCESMQMLIAAGADVNHVSELKHTNALFIASLEAYDTCKIRLLLDNGIDIETTNDAGHTAIFAAASTFRFNAVRLLLEYGTNVHHRDCYGCTALFYVIGLPQLHNVYTDAAFNALGFKYKLRWKTLWYYLSIPFWNFYATHPDKNNGDPMSRLDTISTLIEANIDVDDVDDMDEEGLTSVQLVLRRSFEHREVVDRMIMLKLLSYGARLSVTDLQPALYMFMMKITPTGPVQLQVNVPRDGQSFGSYLKNLIDTYLINDLDLMKAKSTAERWKPMERSASSGAVVTKSKTFTCRRILPQFPNLFRWKSSNTSKLLRVLEDYNILETIEMFEAKYMDILTLLAWDFYRTKKQKDKIREFILFPELTLPVLKKIVYNKYFEEADLMGSFLYTIEFRETVWTEAFNPFFSRRLLKRLNVIQALLYYGDENIAEKTNALFDEIYPLFEKLTPEIKPYIRNDPAALFRPCEGESDFSEIPFSGGSLYISEYEYD